MSDVIDDDRQDQFGETKHLITKSDEQKDLENSRNSTSSHEQSVSLYLLYKDSPVEATGCAIDCYARAPIFLSSLFIGTALLKLASTQAIELAGCLEEDEDYTECANGSKVYGFKPSSLLTNMNSIASIVSILSLPLFGAVVDFTPYRRQVGMYTAFGLALVKIFELGIGPSTWVFVVCLQVMAAFFYQTHQTTMYAYSAELSDHPGNQSRFQSSFALILFVSMFLYELEVLIPSQILYFDDVKTARFATLVAVGNCVPLFLVGWVFFFRDKPSTSVLPHGQTLFTAGFHKLASTFDEISRKFKTLRRFMLYSLIWTEASIAALPAIAITWMSEYLKMNSVQVGSVLLVNFIGGMPGSFIGHYYSRRYNSPVWSVQIALLIFTFNTLAASFFVTANTQQWTYIVSFVWGICNGWIRPQNVTIFVTISPKEKGPVQIMGLYLFVCQVLTFVPPFVFTILNEAGLSMWVGMSSVAMFSFLGFIGLASIGDYEEARKLVRVEPTTL